MLLYQKETSWNTIRFDSRTYTSQLARGLSDQTVVRIPENYIFIDDKCFMENGKIKEVLLPPRCRIIGKQAFQGCQFRKQVVFPETLVEIKKRAFAENKNLRQVHFPASLSILGMQCYRECCNLKTVVFPEGSRCVQIPEGAFDSCVRMNRIQLPAGTREIGDRAFYRCKELKEVLLPDTLIRVGAEAFYFCGMEDLLLPEGLLEIGDSAFFRCKSLRHVRIPESVKTIGRWAFHGCSRLESLEISHDPEQVGPWIVNKSCTIRCHKGSRMDAYCEEFGLKKEYIRDSRIQNRE